MVREGAPSMTLVELAEGVDADRRRHDGVAAGRESALMRTGITCWPLDDGCAFDVNALYSVFHSGHAGFQAKFLDMLRARGTKRHNVLLTPFGLDASDPAFWSKGSDVISGFIDEFEAGG
jgi:hypothetical protein